MHDELLFDNEIGLCRLGEATPRTQDFIDNRHTNPLSGDIIERK
jgi:hypothetical protein